MDILYKLFAPLKYKKIKHQQKSIVDVYLPLIVAVLSAIMCIFVPEPVVILGEDGLLKSLSGYLQFLTGFFVASVAAIATFPNKNMDVITDGIALRLNGEQLTRRQFLSYLFGYLAFLGLMLVAIGGVAELFEKNIQLLLTLSTSMLLMIFKGVFLIIYLYYVFSIMFITLYGLYYLTEKIHENKAEFTGEVGNAAESKDERGNNP